MKQLILFIIFGVVSMSNNVFSQNRLIEGECVLGDCMEGEGEFKYVNGDSYKGYYLNGLPHGYGIYRWKNNKTYKGYFVNGVMEGSGSIVEFGADSIYIGDFKNGKRNGKGRMDYILMKSYFTGMYRDGKRNGQGIYTTKDSVRYSGYYINNSLLFPSTIKYNNKDEYFGSWNCVLEKQGEGTLYKNSKEEIWIGKWNENKLINGWIIDRCCKQSQVKDGEIIAVLDLSNETKCFCGDELMRSNQIISYIGRRIDTLNLRLNNRELLLQEVLEEKRKELILNTIQNVDMAYKIIDDLAGEVDIINNHKYFYISNKTILEVLIENQIKAIEKIFDIKALEGCFGKETFIAAVQESIPLELKFIITTPVESITEQMRKQILQSSLKRHGLEERDFVVNEMYEICDKITGLAGPCIKTMLLKSSKQANVYSLMFSVAPEVGIILGNSIANWEIDWSMYGAQMEYDVLENETELSKDYLMKIKNEYQNSINQGMDVINIFTKQSEFNICQYNKIWLENLKSTYLRLNASIETKNERIELKELELIYHRYLNY